MSHTTELFMGMRSLFRLYDKMLKRVCTEYDLTVIEGDIISFLQNNPGKHTAVDIVELRMLSKGAVSKGVDALIRKGLLERIPDMQDRRRIHLKLNRQAEPVMESINEVRQDFLNIVLEGFTKEELKMYDQFFDRLFHNIENALERGKTL